MGASGAFADDLTVNVAGVKNASGQVVICLWNSAGTFPDCGRSEPFKKQAVAAAAGTVTATFSGIRDGTYAVSAWHNESGDGKPKYNLLGIPADGVGVSNKGGKASGKPTFDDAKFELKGAQSVTVTLQY
jgi:uncharacterized protein (DUF2141 family)